MKKVVSATLAGALAVGMVPAMALADDSVELLVSEPAAIAAGSVILKDGQTDGQSFAYGSKGYLMPVKVKPMDVTAEIGYEDVDQITIMKLGTAVDGNAATDWNDGGKTIYWTEYTKYDVTSTGLVAVQNGGTELDEEALPVGTYAVGAWVDGTAVKDVVTFTIAGADATGLEFFDNSNGAKTDPASNYDIEDEVITFKNDAYALSEGAGLGLKIGTEDVTALFSLTGTVKNANGIVLQGGLNNLVYAGTYYVQVEGSGKYEGVSEYVPVTISPVDVKDLVVTLGNLDAAGVANNDEPEILKVNGVDYDSQHPLWGLLQVSQLPMSYAASGSYTATVGVVPCTDPELKALYDASIYGTTTASFTVATYKNVDIKVFYNGVEGAVPPSINYSVDGTLDFSEAGISVKYTPVGGAEKVAADADEVITYMKNTVKGYVPCTAADLKTAGEYKVFVTLKSTADQAFETEEFAIDVTYGALTDANVSVTNKGVGVYSQPITAVYDGTDVMEDIAIVVRDAKGAVVPASDYTVTILNTVDKLGKQITDPAKQVVSEIVDAGAYSIVIKSTKYDLDVTYAVSVSAEDVQPWIADFAEDGKRLTGTVLYTGEAIDPISKFTMYKDVDGDGKSEYVDAEFAIDASEYKVTIKNFRAEGAKVDAAKLPTEVKEAGVYTIEIADVANGNVAVKNNADFTLTVTTTPVFVDVAAGKFYTEAVHDLAVKGIMGGYGNGKFGVSDDAERQDVAVTALRLLDPTYRLNAKGESEDNDKDYEGIILPFADTDEDAYYAHAVWYCNKNGIMTGYADGSNEFGVGDAVTREQVAAILFRIDEAGLYKAEDTLLKASALDAYKDADEISKYAVEAMEWAVENGIFGVNTAYLNPGEDITRAELAVVIDRYMELRKMA